LEFNPQRLRFWTGPQATQRLHQLLADNQSGIPDVRTIHRIDGVWHDGPTTRPVPMRGEMGIR
jgi:hypothetical protein